MPTARNRVHRSSCVSGNRARENDVEDNSAFTSGEVFADGTAIELVGQNGQPERASLLLWDGAKTTIARAVKHGGQVHKPAPINPSILRDMTLPRHSSPPGSTRDLLTELRKLVISFIGLPETSASLVARCFLSSWIIRALPIAPLLSITGPDEFRGNRLLQLSHCVCRHPLRMSEVTPAVLYSLPTGIEFTLLLSQSTISDRVQRLLDGARRPDQKIAARRGLLDLYGLQVAHSQSALGERSWSHRSVHIPMVFANQRLPTFDEKAMREIADKFQSRLLGYRFANYRKASTLQFDASRLTHSLRELAQSLAATTPDEVSLQEEVLELLADEDRAVRSANWIGFDTVVVESLIVAYHEWPGEEKYIGELAEIAEEIWKRRGVNTEVDAGAYGKKLKLLGFVPEPRDAKGVKLCITEAMYRRAEELAQIYNPPEVDTEVQAARVPEGLNKPRAKRWRAV